jgi:hypothetical protein
VISAPNHEQIACASPVAQQDLESARPRRTFQQLTQLRMNWASYHHFSAEEWLHYFVEIDLAATTNHPLVDRGRNTFESKPCRLHH